MCCMWIIIVVHCWFCYLNRTFVTGLLFFVVADVVVVVFLNHQVCCVLVAHFCCFAVICCSLLLICCSIRVIVASFCCVISGPKKWLQSIPRVGDGTRLGQAIAPFLSSIVRMLLLFLFLLVQVFYQYESWIFVVLLSEQDTCNRVVVFLLLLFSLLLL